VCWSSQPDGGVDINMPHRELEPRPLSPLADGNQEICAGPAPPVSYVRMVQISAGGPMPIAHDFSLDAKYRQESGVILPSGIQSVGGINALLTELPFSAPPPPPPCRCCCPAQNGEGDGPGGTSDFVAHLDRVSGDHRVVVIDPRPQRFSTG
jgi:hypothetical protein